MKPFYASFFFLFLTATPGLQAWGLPVGGQGTSKTAKQTPSTETASKAKSFPVRPKAIARESKPLAAVAAKRRVSIPEAAIQLRKPSLLEQARTLTQQEILVRFDVDLDGRLNAKEASAARLETEKRKGLKAGLLKRFDDNKNKRLDAAEMSRARAEFAADRRKLTLAKYDRNHNGLLDPVERKCLQTDYERDLALVKLQRRFDSNHDNVLDAKEAAKLQRYKAEQKRKGLDPLRPDKIPAKAPAGIQDSPTAKPSSKTRKSAKPKSSTKVKATSNKQRGDLERSPTKG